MAADAIDMDEPLIIFSQDTHMSGPLEEVRRYCPEELLPYFDDFAANAQTANDAVKNSDVFQQPEFRAFLERNVLNQQSAGGGNVEARLADLDRDGVAAAAIFHGGNGTPFPLAPQNFFFGGFLSDTLPNDEQLKLTATGIHIYNEWLADACSLQPERHVACAHVPNWDPEATRQEIEWASERGFRSINWPAPRFGMVEYDNPAWDAVFATCAERGIVLNTHTGAIVPGMFAEDPAPLPHGGALVLLESNGWPARRGLHRMVFSGVFERYPDLKFVLTELAGPWWPTAMNEMDGAYEANYASVKGFLPRKPSEYCATNVFIGSSFTAAFEAQDAVDHDYVDNLLWGSDYPHPEGSWKLPESEDEESTTKLHLRHTFSSIPPAATKQMLGENAIRVYGLDREALAAHARRIQAPTLRDIATPLDAIPDSFRYSTNPGTGSAFHKPNMAASWSG